MIYKLIIQSQRKFVNIVELHERIKVEFPIIIVELHKIGRIEYEFE